MSRTIEGFGAAYAAAFRSYLADESEASLRNAYELGRDAVVRELSVLDLVLVHHDALVDALHEAGGATDGERVARAAGAFLLESVSSFEMVRRGFDEAREAALVERRHAAMLRQLSSFLADVSLALAAPGPLEEMLQLVAEQARELLECDWCRVTAGGAGDEVREAVSAADVGGATPGQSPSLTAALTALDGRTIGSIELMRKRGGEFSGVDEAVLTHLAQMVSAAVERSALYQRNE